jgi:hypothetical protein
MSGLPRERPGYIVRYSIDRTAASAPGYRPRAELRASTARCTEHRQLQVRRSWRCWVKLRWQGKALRSRDTGERDDVDARIRRGKAHDAAVRGAERAVRGHPARRSRGRARARGSGAAARGEGAYLSRSGRQRGACSRPGLWAVRSGHHRGSGCATTSRWPLGTRGVPPKIARSRRRRARAFGRRVPQDCDPRPEVHYAARWISRRSGGVPAGGSFSCQRSVSRPVSSRTHVPRSRGAAGFPPLAMGAAVATTGDCPGRCARGWWCLSHATRSSRISSAKWRSARFSGNSLR